MIFEEVAWDPACRLEVPGDPGGPRKPQEIPGSAKSHQDAPRGPRYQRVPRGSRRSKEALRAGPLLGIVLRRSVIESGVRKNSGECPFTKRG